MSLIVELENGLEDRVRQEAGKRGLQADEYVRAMLEQRVPVQQKRHPFSELVQEWIDEGDEKEQRETLEAIMKGLQENPVAFREINP